ncbi:MAG TPA: nitric oxide reductase transcriptional regulator NorR [Kofleriaceae bacterium]|nr:nitric oxide reductase transcriptional regulator NorR [Kofleriaceae bacterium]
MSSPQHPWSTLHRLAVDLTESLSEADRYRRLLAVVRSAIPCDATALLALRDGVLHPLAVEGLSPQVLGMRFAPAHHPRLAAILRSAGPVRFPAASALPDPFDGLVDGAAHALADVHDCLGCPLVAQGEIVGVLTADALATHAFDALDTEFLRALGALAGAALHTARLLETVEAVAEQRGLVVKELARTQGHPDGATMLGVSPAMERVRQEIEAVAATGFPVLVLGETGVGKELAARALHDASPRRDAPMIRVNCAALPQGVIESELFGHVRGAFTGAVAHRAGKFELADGGTLFLDEIGELPLDAQAKLLRALQEREIQRVGADAAIRVNVRIVAATNRDLAAEVAAGRFRADLYHRLDVFPLRIPPLRERRGDIPILAGYFVDRYRAQLGLHRLALGPQMTELLASGDWPGNVRELDHVLARAALRAQLRTRAGEPVTIEAIDLELGAPSPAPPREPAQEALAQRVARGQLTLRAAVAQLKHTAIVQTLAATRGNWAESARRLGMDRGNLHHMATRLGISRAR